MVKPLARTVLRDGVYDSLLEMLLTELEPGSSLSIDGLARELGVSPTPVREALVQLEHTGLVSRAALKGYRVAPPLSPEQIAELVDARMVVELAAVEGAVRRGGGVVADLRDLHARHQDALVDAVARDGASARTAAVRRYFEADWAFHVAILDASGNPYLRQMLESLGVRLHRLRQAVGHGVSDGDAAVREHAEVLRAFEEGDAQRAVAAMRAHLEGVRDRSVADATSVTSAGLPG